MYQYIWFEQLNSYVLIVLNICFLIITKENS